MDTKKLDIVKYLLVLLMFCCLNCKSQEKEINNSFTKLIKEFCNELLTKDNIAISEAKKYFGDEILLTEENAYMDSCLVSDVERNCVKKLQNSFDDLSTMNSLFYKKCKKDLSAILPDNSDAVFRAVDDAQIIESIFVMSLNDKNLYFSMGYSEDLINPIIYGIYDSDGSHILNKNSFVRFKGGLVDDDSYVNVRREPTKSGDIIKKLFTHDFIWFTPSNDNKWWRVYSIDRSLFLGYVHNSRIRHFNKLSANQKKQIIEWNKEQYPWVISLDN